MKISITTHLVSIAGLLAATSIHGAPLIRGTPIEGMDDIYLEEEEEQQQQQQSQKHRALTNTCVGSTMVPGDVLLGGQSICNTIGGERVDFGVRMYPNNPRTGYTLYRVELWSENGTHDRYYSGIGTQGPAPVLKLQADGNLLFGGSSFSRCQAKPARRGSQVVARMDGPLPDLLKVYDSDGDIVWSLRQRELSNGRVIVVGSGCYPDQEAKCLPILNHDERISWNDYVCEYDGEGNVVTRFGLDKSGLLALWRNDARKWRPMEGSSWVRGDYLHLQNDGHLTLYRDRKPKTFPWKTGCLGPQSRDGSKLAVVGGHVYQVNTDGSIGWGLVGEDGLSEICFPFCME